MQRGLYIAATGMLSQSLRQDTISSNLANVNTVGYKKDRVVNETFDSLFLRNLANNNPLGELNLGTKVAGTVTDYTQGSLRHTGETTDLALTGDGFFTTLTTDGDVRYTRNGQFNVNAQGFLVNQSGDLVLSTANGGIFVGDGELSVAGDGRVFVDNQLAAQLRLVTLDIETAKKAGSSGWTGTETGFAANASIKQGYLEQSTVNSIEEMVEMITALRNYESSQRVMQSIDSTLDRAVNSVGVVQ